MPTFTVIALDRLLEPGASSKSADMSSLPNSNSKPFSSSMPVPDSKLERRNSTSVVEKRPHRPQIRPALYATPEATPLPDLPTSFPPSPYIINHKRRGPRLMKSYSEQDVSLHQKAGGGEKLNGDVNRVEAKAVKLNGNVSNAEAKVANSPVDDLNTFTFSKPVEVRHSNGVHHFVSSNGQLRGSNVELGSSSEHEDNFYASNNKRSSDVELSNGSAREDDLLKQVAMSPERDSEREDFVDLKDSMSVASYNTDGEGNFGAERSAQTSTPMGEFYDAWDELSSESGQGQQLSVSDVEVELREMRLSLIMEIEKRKQVEESLNNMRRQWQRIREQLSLVGFTLPEDPTVASGHEQLGSDPAEDLYQQVYLARFVSNTIGRGLIRAEMEMEMEAQVESKNFEIARLMDKLRNYEAMNQEMVQRNQDVLEMARRDRERRERRQRWVWGSIATALTLGTAALAYSYIPSSRGSPSFDSEVPERSDAGK
ncbi:hypothetical protein ACFX1Z_018469 [Malus domestica]